MSRKKQTRKFPKKYCTIDYYECVDYTETGQCIINFKNKPFYIDAMVKGEKAKIQVFYEYPENGQGRAVLLEEKSPNRKLDLNHPKLQLGSYQIAHLTDEAQDDFKQTKIEELFGKTNKIIVGNRTNYRNKVVLSDGGFMPPGRSRKLKVTPTKENFDLMDFDFSPYTESVGDLIIRKLDTTIIGKPGDNISTTHTFGHCKFSVNLNSFYQVNSEMAKLAYDEIKKFVPENSIVFDLFAGAATIGIYISDRAKKVYSVEISKNSIEDAKINIALNDVKNLEIINEDANKWILNNGIEADVIIVDPARAGLSMESAIALNKSNAKRIIYLSCNIYTQKTDANYLTNYRIVHIQPFDFFPQTYHIENLIIFEKL